MPKIISYPTEMVLQATPPEPRLTYGVYVRSYQWQTPLSVVPWLSLKEGVSTSFMFHPIQPSLVVTFTFF